MQRAQRIANALEKRRFTPFLAERIEHLLDGREDRSRLSCCSSGCFVCVKELLAILAEIESAERAERAESAQNGESVERPESGTGDLTVQRPGPAASPSTE